MYKVLLLYSKRIPSVILCAQIQLQYLSKNKQICLEENSIWNVTIEQCNSSEIIIIVRGSSKSELIFIQEMKKLGKEIIYVIDDDLLEVPFYSKSYQYFTTPSIKKNITKLIQISDVLVSPSILLLKKYGQKKKIALIKETVTECKSQIRKEKIRIGFAGSLDREYEFTKLLQEVLKEIKKKYGNEIEMECIGISSEDIHCYIDRIYSYVPVYEDYLNLMEERNWDIGLAPLSSSHFNKCKYYNKYLEYGRFGIIGIYSDVYPYSKKIKNGCNGVLVKNEKQLWIKALETLIEDREKQEVIRHNILKDIKENYLIKDCAEEYFHKVIMQCEVKQNKKMNRFFYYILKTKLYLGWFFDGFIRKIQNNLLII